MQGIECSGYVDKTRNMPLRVAVLHVRLSDIGTSGDGRSKPGGKTLNIVGRCGKVQSVLL